MKFVISEWFKRMDELEAGVSEWTFRQVDEIESEDIVEAADVASRKYPDLKLRVSDGHRWSIETEPGKILSEEEKTKLRELFKENR